MIVSTAGSPTVRLYSRKDLGATMNATTSAAPIIITHGSPLGPVRPDIQRGSTLSAILRNQAPRPFLLSGPDPFSDSLVMPEPLCIYSRLRGRPLLEEG